MFKKLFDKNERMIKKYSKIVEEINRYHRSEIAHLNNLQLHEKFRELKENMENIDDSLIEIFAIVREVAKRTLGMKHFDVQLMGGIALHEGKVAEMKTGEGKTLVATLPLVLNALEGKGAHLVTVNDYLARRDALWMGPVYLFLGLRVGVINPLNRSYEVVWEDPEKVEKAIQENLQVWPEGFDGDVPPEESLNQKALEAFKVRLIETTRREAYLCDITYGTNNEFGFDYLRDNLVYDIKDKVQRGHHYAIVDEVDSILIDEARTPLIISGPSKGGTGLYRQFNAYAKRFKKDVDFVVDEKHRTVTLTEEGMDKLERLLGVENLYDPSNID
ncbi:MAG TPA: preprotein translocase subunit SecA, partial [Thermotogae bacterium]|nr:preprotein translocase subunit SecA [Thermotogota bacterium]